MRSKPTYLYKDKMTATTISFLCPCCSNVFPIFPPLNFVKLDHNPYVSPTNELIRINTEAAVCKECLPTVKKYKSCIDYLNTKAD